MMESVELARLKAMSMASMEIIEYLKECETVNEQRIVRYLSHNNSNRKNICLGTGLKWTTAYDNLMKLKQKGIVGYYSLKNGKKGRSRTIWYLVRGI